jgi:hypothetical protein
MTNQKKRSPWWAQKADEEVLQQNPSFSQEDFPTIDEELLEGVSGGGNTLTMNPRPFIDIVLTPPNHFLSQ